MDMAGNSVCVGCLLPWRFCGQTGGKHGKPPLEGLVSGQKFEPWMSAIYSKSFTSTLYVLCVIHNPCISRICKILITANARRGFT